MIISRGRLSFPRFEQKKLVKYLDESVRASMRAAAALWLRAVIPKVPVWTGTSQGSLMPLARLIRVALHPTPVVVRPGMGPAVGASRAPQTMAAYFPAPRGNVYHFQFTTNVAHFIYNNLQHAPNPPFNLIHETPWYATAAGNRAFNAYMRDKLPTIVRSIRLKDYISFQSISYGRG